MEMVRYCPACDDEFRPDFTTCSVCGTALILQAEGVGASGAPDLTEHGEPVMALGAWRTALDSAPISSLVPIKTFDSLEDLEPAVGAFSDAQLPSRVLVQNGRYILLVRPESLGDAQTALEAIHLEEGSDADVEEGFDAASGRYSDCPACDAKLDANSTGTCPECGLELSSPGGTIAVPEGE